MSMYCCVVESDRIDGNVRYLSMIMKTKTKFEHYEESIVIICNAELGFFHAVFMWLFLRNLEAKMRRLKAVRSRDNIAFFSLETSRESSAKN